MVAHSGEFPGHAGEHSARKVECENGGGRVSVPHDSREAPLAAADVRDALFSQVAQVLQD